MRANVARVRATRTRLAARSRTSASRCCRRRRTSCWRGAPAATSAPLHAPLAGRDVLVRHFPTPELRDALRITVGTDDGDRRAARGAARKL
jgi:histidinol-phosphate/aromatic aminotransferase/cobyric acid decarboxylase-like protein